MTDFVGNIERLTLNNTNFRRVLYTGTHSQIVIMSLKPNEDIGLETHKEVDQFLKIEKGEGEALLNGEKHPLKDGDAILVPAGVEHNITNTSPKKPLSLYTIYSPPHHRDGVTHKTKEEALKDKSDHV